MPHPFLEQKLKEFEKKFCIDPSRAFFGDPEKLKSEGWIVGGSGLMVKTDIDVENIKSFLLSTAEEYHRERLKELEKIFEARIERDKELEKIGVSGTFRADELREKLENIVLTLLTKE